LSGRALPEGSTAEDPELPGVAAGGGSPPLDPREHPGAPKSSAPANTNTNTNTKIPDAAEEKRLGPPTLRPAR
ncbi:MAG TPA: hypothetical protein VK459_18800, partial [Polyangiaceae bacterium]|nr:hypothetical protein [Polyangiaceae bacterium]